MFVQPAQMFPQVALVGATIHGIIAIMKGAGEMFSTAPAEAEALNWDDVENSLDRLEIDYENVNILLKACRLHVAMRGQS